METSIASSLARPADWLRFLDPPSRSPRWTWWETAAFVLYLAMLSFGIAQHVPWADESQAWMLAQDVSLRYLLLHSLHYEGHPGLWHCLLKLLQLAHISFTGARWVAGGLQAAGMAVLLAWAPFPRLVRLLLPFSFFLAYQDAVIARSYVLFALLAFSAAALLRSHQPRPLRLAVLLGLMANISLHTLIASVGMAGVALAVWRETLVRRHLPAAGVLLALWAFSAWSLAPARDIDFSAGNNVWRSLAKVEAQLGIHAPPPPPAISDLGMAGLPRKPLPVHLRTGSQGARKKLVRLLAVITFPLSASRTLALLLFALVAAQACITWRARPAQPTTSTATHDRLHAEAPTSPLGLAPYLLMVLAFTSLYLEPRHAGVVFTGFVVSAWLTWPAHTVVLSRNGLLLQRTTAAVFAVVLLLQAGWTVAALRAEHTQPYSPDQQTAALLAALPPGTRIDGFYYYSAGPLLYFDHNLYANQPPHRYWLWSTATRSYSTVQEVLARGDRVIVVGGYTPGPQAEVTRDWQPLTPPEAGVALGDVFLVTDFFLHHGYHETHLFCGHSWMRGSYTEQVCNRILERDNR